MGRTRHRIDGVTVKMAPVAAALLADLWDKVPAGRAGAGDAQVLRIVEAELAALSAEAAAARREVAARRRLLQPTAARGGGR